jgi:hypothetical protein
MSESVSVAMLPVHWTTTSKLKRTRLRTLSLI